MKNLCLIVIDGYGISDKKEGNAILNANIPVMTELESNKDQYLTLEASGEAVGLPAGLMGNSEVGHMNIGAGRVVEQEILRINKDVEKKAVASNPTFSEYANKAKSGNGRLHFLGLVSDGGVHSHINHLFALLEGAKQIGVPEVFIHFFADGRDTSPMVAIQYIQQVLDKTVELGCGILSTIMGRYYAMDRDKKYDRLKIAFDALVSGSGEKTNPNDVIAKVKERYSNQKEPETDEFLKPIIVNEEGMIGDNDTLIFTNYRADRMRQIVEAFALKQHFKTDKVPQKLKICTMTQYKKEFPFDMLYAPIIPENTLPEWISKKGLAQFHCAESEKYAHVTFFFGGGREEVFDKEDRVMIPSPNVATYDLEPEMSCIQVAEEMVKAIKSEKYPFVMCNLAPPDMVGHTGIYEKTIEAVEATDKAIGIILEACVASNYILVVTADHGNAETMIDENGEPSKSHTTNRVPFILKNSQKLKELHDEAALCDVAPTVLDLMEIEKPAEMTGESLIA